MKRRLATLQTGNPYQLTVKAEFECKSKAEAYDLEQAFLQVFKNVQGAHVRGEWFRWTQIAPVYKRLNREKWFRKRRMEQTGEFEPLPKTKTSKGVGITLDSPQRRQARALAKKRRREAT